MKGASLHPAAPGFDSDTLAAAFGQAPIGTDADFRTHASLVAALQRKVGRLIANGVPSFGVSVGARGSQVAVRMERQIVPGQN